MKNVLLVFIVLVTSGQLFAQQLLEKTITVDGLEREYLLYVPAAYDGNENWPLVFNLHGLDGNSFEQDFRTQMRPIADTAHFLLVLPQALPNQEGASDWNELSDPSGADDVKFFSTLIDTISQSYTVNQSRIYSVGYSDGAIMSFALACALSDRIAAIGAVGAPGPASLAPSLCQPERPMPIIYMHGTADLIVPFNGGQSIFPQIDDEIPPARNEVAFWQANNGCDSEPALTALPDINTSDGSMVVLERYTDCEASTELLFYVIENGGHTWPGSPAESVPTGLEFAFGNINGDIQASSEIWNFFNRHELPELTTSIEDGIAEFDRLSIFPNPATTSTQIRLTTQEAAALLVTLYSLKGDVVLQRSTGLLSIGYNEVNLDLSDVPNGTYLLTLSSQERVNSSVLVVQKSY